MLNTITPTWCLLVDERGKGAAAKLTLFERRQSVFCVYDCAALVMARFYLRALSGCRLLFSAPPFPLSWNLGTRESSEKTIAILGGRWRPQKTKQEGDKDEQNVSPCAHPNPPSHGESRGSKRPRAAVPRGVMYGKKRIERPNVGGVSIRSGNGAPSRRGCVVNGQRT